MPTYQYRCTECDDSLEVAQRFTDDPLTVCPACSGRLRKVFSPVGVVFKGSGFYKTDSRTARKRSDGAKAGDAAAKTGDSGDGTGTAAASPAAGAGSTPAGGSKSDGPKANGSKSGSKAPSGSNGSTRSASKEPVHKVA